MRVGVVGDIYGNLRGLEQALRAMGPIGRLLFTGDGYSEIARAKNKFTQSRGSPEIVTFTRYIRWNSFCDWISIM